MTRLALLVATAAALLFWLPGCTRIIEKPVPVVPPPCLMTLAPAPPESEDDEAWEGYHARLEAWAAHVERSCGVHLLPAAPDPDDDEPAWRSEVPR